MFSFIPCHRLDERSLHYKGKKSPLCSRCMGIYLSIPFGILLGFLFLKLELITFIISSVLLIPLIIDGYTQKYKFRKSNNFLRVLTGTLFGLGYGFIIVLSFYYIINILP